jgi:hypothetical protein
MNRWLLILLLLTGCSRVNTGGPKKFLLPWPDASGNYTLQEITLTTLPSPYELKGDAAEVYYQSPFSADGYSSSIAKPHLTKSGDVYVPQDTESAQALAVYAQMERLYQFEQQLGTASQITWPRKIGVSLNLIGDPVNTTNNAAYYSSLDVVGLLPYTLSHKDTLCLNQLCVPLAVNHGIVAHEHFHTHFQSQVMAAMSHDPDSTISLSVNSLFAALSVAPPSSVPSQAPIASGDDSAHHVNNVVFRGWNEGLADLFAAIYTNQADFFSETLPRLTPFRALNGPLTEFWTGNDFVPKAQAQTNSNKMSSDQWVGIAYMQGTALSRVLYELAYNGSETPTAFELRILQRLRQLPAKFNDTFDQTRLDVDAILPVLLDGFPLNSATCNTLKAANVQGGFSACGP